MNQANNTDRKIDVTVVGGGNSAHALIPLLTATGHNVSLMTSRPDEWNEKIYCDLINMDGEVTKTFVGKCQKISKDPLDVIPNADAIILCLPVHQYRDALDRIAPHINKNKSDVFVGTLYGQAGFNWMVHEIEQRYNLKNIVCFAFALIPWICRTSKYGSHAANYGGKQLNICAITPSSKFEELCDLLLNDISFIPLGIGKCALACSFLSITLSVDNQIIHPSRCFGLYKKSKGRWPSIEKVPYFYRDFDDVSSAILKNVDNDYSAIRAAVRKRFPSRSFTYMLSYTDLESLSHSSKHIDIKASFTDSKQLGSIKTPTVEAEDGSQVLDTKCRFFTDDIPYGMLLAKWVAQELNVDTPHVDRIIVWAQKLRGEHWLNDGDCTIDMEFCLKHNAGIPPVYGLHSVDEILD